jgi:DUF1680 family protein
MEDSFWAPRQKTVREVSIPWITRHHDKAGGLEAFRKNAGSYVPRIPNGEMEHIKLIEGMASVIGVQRDAAIAGLTDAWIGPLVKAQGSDGYLGEHFPAGLNHPANRWQPIWWSHEDYIIGHYIEAALAYREVTDDDLMYRSALRAADNMVADFRDGRRAYAPGHPEIEQALMRLYGSTGDRKYLQLCGWLLEQRGKHSGRDSYGRMRLDDIPVKQQRTVQGHAVMAAYLFNGVTHYVGATGDAEYREAALAVWDDFVNHKMYVHGGGGTQSSKIEGYRKNPDCILPNDAYCESCSVWGNFQWAHSLFRLAGDAKYIDTAERMLCNAFYASLSLQGDSSFYVNVVQTDVPRPRSADLATSCCPPNIVKLFSTVGGYFYSTDVDGVFIKHYGASEAQIPFGKGLALTQRTNYPWDGSIRIGVEPEAAATFSLRLRSPAWAKTRTVSVNGQKVEAVSINGWLTLHRRWKSGDVVEIDFPMRIERVSMPARFAEYENHVALQRGPVVYCLEEQDLALDGGQDGTPSVGAANTWGKGLSGLYIPEEENFTAEHRADFLGGVTVLKGSVRQLNFKDDSEKSIPVMFVPYGVWANRIPGAMRIWLGARKAPLVELLLPQQKAGESCVG